MNKNDHIKYIDDLTAMQDAEGKRISSLILAAMGKLLAVSGGSPAKFAAMVKALRKKLVAELVLEANRSRLEARKLGQDFGRKKLGD